MGDDDFDDYEDEDEKELELQSVEQDEFDNLKKNSAESDSENIDKSISKAQAQQLREANYKAYL